MPLTHSNATLSDPIDKSEIETNFAETRAKFGSIINADIASNAAIAVSKLAVSNQEILINLAVDSSVFASGWPAATTDPLVWVPVPGDDTDDDLTIVDATYMCSEPGTTADFIVEWSDYTGGTWGGTGPVTTVISSTVIDNTGNPSLATSTVSFHASALRGFGLQSNGADSACLSAANKSFSLTLLCKRVIQA